MAKRQRQKQRQQVKDAVTEAKPKPKPQRTADSFTNPLARLGFGQPNLLEGTDYQLTRLSRNIQQLNAMYRSHWLVRKIVDGPAEDMVKNWYTIESQVEPDLLDQLRRMEDRTMVQAKILQALKWGRLYGGAGAVMLIDGHHDMLDQPLDYETIAPGAFKGLLVVDRWNGIEPSTELVDDINDPEYGLPAYYTITTNSAKTIRVDHSRVLRFTGREVPYLETLAETYWGISEIEVIYDELKKRDNTSWNIANLIFLANIRVLKQADLGQLLGMSDEASQAQLYNTMSAQNMLMSNMGLMLLDKDDDFAMHSYTFSGLDKVYENFMMDLSGAAEMPVTKLFGRSPAGLNATGDGDMQTYYDTTSQKQTSALRPVFNKLLPVMCVSEWGAVPDDLDYKFNPIGMPSDKDKVDLAQKGTEAVSSAYAQGLISQKTALKELRQQSSITGIFGNITDEDIEAADETTTLAGLGGEEDGPVEAEAENRTELQEGN